jgi:lipopolysaccharide biosynthesis glycosyltransferase
MRATIISAADEGYFPLLKGLVLSIIEHRPNENMGIAALDIGMRADQIAELQSLNVVVTPAKWDFDFRGMDETPRYLQAMTARPCLPNYFPDTDLLIWIDAEPRRDAKHMAVI